MKYHFCTYFDSNYACLGLALYASLAAHCCEFTLYVCCLDDQLFDILCELNLPHVIPVRLSDIERFDNEFAATKHNRSQVEYYFTLSPVLPLYLFEKFSDAKAITYLDSDLYFYDSPQPIFDEFGNNSLSLIEHRFPPELKFREKFGRYNLQFQIYSRDNNCLSCLYWWRERCLEWCYDRLENGRFADQKYLEQWPELFTGVKVIEHKGAGLAPWNWFQYNIQCAANQVTIDNQPLIFYHFQGFRILGKYFISHNLGSYGKVMPKNLLHFFYVGYYNALKAAEKQLKSARSAQNITLDSKLNRAGFSKWRAYLSAIRHRNLMFIN